LKANQRLGGTCHLHLQGRRVGEEETSVALLATFFHAGFLLGSLFDPEDGDDMFLRNVGDFQRAAQRYIPGDRTFHNPGCEDLK
jgi:hypothetical protein